MTALEYDHVRAVMTGLDGAVTWSDDLGTYAAELAHKGWPVFPLAGKIPAIPKSRGGNGVLDATTDPETIARWWGLEYRNANIGIRVPESLFVLDIDPRHEGHLRIAEHEAKHGTLPQTLMAYSGRGDGGRHLYYRHPGGSISSKRLGTGVDVKTHSGYVVAPPSIHPDSGKAYRWQHAPIVRAPYWLRALLAPEVKAPEAVVRPRGGVWDQFTGDSIADAYSARTSWRQILTGWTVVRGDGDSDGSAWRHPTATSQLSATVRNGCLFVYSPNTPFEVTEAGDVHGYTRFRAYAVLNHRGDLSAAARQLRQEAA